MKKNTMYLRSKKALILLFACVTFFACKKNTAIVPTPAVTGAFTYKADGIASTADSAIAILYGPKNARIMDIYSHTGKKEGMEFHFSPKTGAQTVTNTFGSGALLTYYDANSIEYDSQSGSFNLTTCDTLKKIEGDFSFVGKMFQAPGTGTKTITEGHLTITKILHQ